MEIKINENVRDKRLLRMYEISDIKSELRSCRSRLDTVNGSSQAQSTLSDILRRVEEVEQKLQQLGNYKNKSADEFYKLDHSISKQTSNHNIVTFLDGYRSDNSSYSNWIQNIKAEKLNVLAKALGLPLVLGQPSVTLPLNGMYKLLQSDRLRSNILNASVDVQVNRVDGLKNIADKLLGAPYTTTVSKVVKNIYEDIKEIPLCAEVPEYLREHPEMAALLPTILLNELPRDIQIDASRIKVEWREERQRQIRKQLKRRQERDAAYWKAFEEGVRSGKIYAAEGEVLKDDLDFGLLVSAEEAEEARLLTNNEEEYYKDELKGVGLQGSISLDIKAISGGAGVEIIWFTDNDFDRDLDGLYSNDSKLIPYIYVFYEGNLSTSPSDVKNISKALKNGVSQMVEELTDVKNMKGLASTSVSGSVFAVVGDDDFNNPYDYLGVFETKSATAFNWKASYAQDPLGNVHTYGIGRDKNMFGLSAGRSNYYMINPEEIEGLPEKLMSLFKIVDDEVKDEVEYEN